MLASQTTSTPEEARALRAAAAAAVGVFAYRDGRGRPLAWPVTPYVDGESVVVTSTLAFIRKAVHARRDGRVALLASGVHMTGHAAVAADPSGAAFVARILAQELRKYPPAQDIVRSPCSRSLFWWYYGRVIVSFRPLGVSARAGSDAASLVWLDERGYPLILPVAPPQPEQASFVLRPRGEGVELPRARAAACVLLHAQPTMRDLRQLLLQGEMERGRFYTCSRSGSLEGESGAGALGELRRLLSYQRRALRSLRTIRGWPRYANGGPP